MKNIKIKWLDKPQSHDYPAAQSYLSIIYDEKTVNDFVKKFQSAQVTSFKAKDIFRASELPLLGPSNSHVNADCKRIKKGIALSPILLVRNPTIGKVIIADGYHRMCAVYSFDEDAIIPCQIIS